MSRRALPPFSRLCCAISRIAFTDSCLAESMKLHVLTTRISASSARAVSRPPARSSSPIITSESTRFFGQPSETKPMVGRAEPCIRVIADMRLERKLSRIQFAETRQS